MPHEYHHRSERKSSSKSSFDHNFGPFVVPDNAAIGIQRGFYYDHKGAGLKPPVAGSAAPHRSGQWLPLWVIERHRRSRGRGDPGRGARLRPGEPRPPNTLEWIGPTLEQLIQHMTPEEIHRAFEQMEYQMANPRAADDVDDTARWVTTTARCHAQAEPRRKALPPTEDRHGHPARHPAGVRVAHHQGPTRRHHRARRLPRRPCHERSSSSSS